MNEDQTQQQTPPAVTTPTDNKPDADTQEWDQAGKALAAEHTPPAKTEPDKKDKGSTEQKPAEIKPIDEKAKKAEEEVAAKKLEEEQANETPEQKKTREDKEAAAKKLEEERALETPEQKAEREKKEAADAKAVEEAQAKEDDPTYRDQRAVQREIVADSRAMRDDVRKQMFSEVPTQLEDADGDLIRTPQDVMKLMNPNTKKPFTEEEATIWLFQAQKHLEEQLANTDKQIDAIADANIMIRDEADTIRTRYAELLKNMPELFKSVWTEYAKTLTTDEKTEVITKAPVSLEKFFDIALKPYADRAEELSKQDEEDAKKNKKTERTNTQSDRSDIIPGGKSDTMDAEEKEWDAAAKVVYGDK